MHITVKGSLHMMKADHNLTSNDWSCNHNPDYYHTSVSKPINGSLVGPYLQFTLILYIHQAYIPPTLYNPQIHQCPPFSYPLKNQQPPILVHFLPSGYQDSRHLLDLDPWLRSSCSLFSCNQSGIQKQLDRMFLG